MTIGFVSICELDLSEFVNCICLSAWIVFVWEEQSPRVREPEIGRRKNLPAELVWTGRGKGWPGAGAGAGAGAGGREMWPCWWGLILLASFLWTGEKDPLHNLEILRSKTMKIFHCKIVAQLCHF